MDLSERITELASGPAQQAGLVVDDVSVSRSSGRTRVTVTVDLPPDAVGSADLDAVAAASRAIGAALDAADAIPDAYLLDVGTPGLDRPLRERHHYARARTRLATLTLTDGATLTGRIVDVSDAGVSVSTDAGEQVVGWDSLSSGAIQVEFTRSEG